MEALAWSLPTTIQTACQALNKWLSLVIHERVRCHARRARIQKSVSPHRLRHTFATHLVRAGVGIVTIRDLLGHRQITSTQIYLHVTARDLEDAAARHPIQHLAPSIEHLLPDVKLPFQRVPGNSHYG